MRVGVLLLSCTGVEVGGASKQGSVCVGVCACVEVAQALRL